MSITLRSSTLALTTLGLLSVGGAALATTYLNLDSIVSTAPVSVTVDDGVIELGYQIAGEDTFDFSGTLVGTVDGDGELVLDGDDLVLGGTQVVTLGGANRTITYEIAASDDVEGDITPYNGNLWLDFVMNIEFSLIWDDGKTYTCTAETPTVHLTASAGDDYSQTTGLAEVAGSFEMPYVTCTGYRSVTAWAIQTAINTKVATGRTTDVTLPLSFNPVLTQATPPASCGSHPHGSTWAQLSPPNCSSSNPSCTVLACTCDDGVTTCIEP